MQKHPNLPSAERVDRDLSRVHEQMLRENAGPANIIQMNAEFHAASTVLEQYEVLVKYAVKQVKEHMMAMVDWVEGELELAEEDEDE